MSFLDHPVYILIKDVVTVIFTGTALYFAGAGLSTWKKQMKGAKGFEISYNLNYSILKLRDAIKYVRIPAIWDTESYEAEEYAKKKYPAKAEDKEFLRKFSTAFVYEKRWEKITQAYTEAESHLLGARVLWGPEILEKMAPLKKKVNELSASLRLYLDQDLEWNQRERSEKIVFDTGDESKPDSFTREIDGHVAEIGKYLQERDKVTMTRFSLVFRKIRDFFI